APRPAAPPPTTTTSYVAFIVHSLLDSIPRWLRHRHLDENCSHPPQNMASLVAGMAKFPDERRSRVQRGARRRRASVTSLAPAARSHLEPALRAHRHLGEHTVAIGIRASPADA